MSSTRQKRYCQIEVTQMLMDSGDVPKMLYNLQATPTHIEYDYQRRTYRMILVSPQIPLVAEGSEAPLQQVMLNQITKKFEFDL